MSIGIATRGVVVTGGGNNTIYVAHSIEPSSESLGVPIIAVENDATPQQPDNSTIPTVPIRSIQYIDAPNNNKFQLPND